MSGEYVDCTINGQPVRLRGEALREFARILFALQIDAERETVSELRAQAADLKARIRHLEADTQIEHHLAAGAPTSKNGDEADEAAPTRAGHYRTGDGFIGR